MASRGRPTDYNQDIVEAAWKYLNDYSEVHGHAIPSIVGMCKVLKRGKSTIYDWANDENKDFSDILAACNELQELALLNGGLDGTLNSNIVKLTLGKHGYHDKQDTNLGGQKDNPVKVDATLDPGEAYLKMIGKA